MNDIQKSLRCTLVVRRPDTEELYVNWDPRISTLLHEATKIQQLGFDVPYMTQLLLNKAPLLLKKRDMVKVSDLHNHEFNYVSLWCTHVTGENLEHLLLHMYANHVLSSCWQHLLNEHTRVLGKVSKNLTPLLVPHVTKLKEALNPLLTSLTWSSIQAHSYFDQAFQAVKAFEVLIDRWGNTHPLYRFIQTWCLVSSVQ